MTTVSTFRDNYVMVSLILTPLNIVAVFKFVMFQNINAEKMLIFLIEKQ